MAGLGRAEAQQECQRLALYITQFETFRDDLTPRLNVTMELAHKMGLSVGLAAAILLLLMLSVVAVFYLWLSQREEAAA